jgi:hypothetical protein
MRIPLVLAEAPPPLPETAQRRDQIEDRGGEGGLTVGAAQSVQELVQCAQEVLVEGLRPAASIERSGG